MQIVVLRRYERMLKKVKPQARTRKRVNKQANEQANVLLMKAPEEHVFWCHDGTIFRDIKDLADGLGTMSGEIYAYHASLERNDFCNWVRDVIGDQDLAGELAEATSQTQAAECVTSRLHGLTGA